MELLNIRTQQPQIGMKTQFGKFDVKTPPIGLEIRNSAVEVEIHATPDVLQIDQYPSRASCGILSVADTIAQNAKQAEQKASEGIARRAREGSAFSKTAKTSNLLARQAGADLREMPEMKIQLAIVKPPTIKYTQGELKVKVNLKPTALKTNGQSVTIDYTPSKVNIYLRQEANIRMWVSEGKYDIYA